MEKWKELNLKRPNVNLIRKIIGIFIYLMAAIFFIVGLLFIITIIGIVITVFAWFSVVIFLYVGSTFYFGKVEIKCPYCKEKLTVYPLMKSGKCKRCNNLILLKWK